MRRLLFTFLICSIYLSTHAQKAQNVYYFKNGMPTQDKDKADFRRVIQEPDEGSKLYNLYEFYQDNTAKTEGFLSSFEPTLIYEGLLKSYNKRGVLIEETNYVKNSIIGTKKTYYANGKPERELLYDGNLGTPGIQQSATYKTIFYTDSLGNVMIKDGNGYYKSVDKNRSDEGNYLNGVKEGIWKGTVDENSYEESFKDGKFVSGTAKLKDNQVVNYKSEGEIPNFKGGISSFYKYLARNIEYPREAIKQRITGKLYSSFTVDKDGSLTDIKFRNSLGKAIDDEVYRVLQNSPKWIPGTQHGIPVRVKYNINVNLALPN